MLFSITLTSVVNPWPPPKAWGRASVSPGALCWPYISVAAAAATRSVTLEQSFTIPTKNRLVLWNSPLDLRFFSPGHVLIRYGAASAAQAALIEQKRCGWVIIRFILIFGDYSCMQTLPLACLLRWVGRQRSKSLISVESNETRTHSHISAFPPVKGWWGRCHTPLFFVFACDAFNLNHKNTAD